MGGSYYCRGYPDYTCGTVFGITPSGTEKVLQGFYNAKTGGDGAYPTASLIDALEL
jgi:hypothetical protein